MCGINGFTRKNQSRDPVSIVRKMNDALAHRGPDADGVWSNEVVTLGHRRLSIIDTSPAGNQPFFSESRDLVIVFNGEIYNYIELRKETGSDYQFTTSSDTEVLLACYRKWGIKCLEKLVGMFAFALWDNNTHTLYIVRDRLGVKPLYYYEGEDGILFSSEIRALIGTGLVPRKITGEALIDYLSYQTVHAPSTILENVKMLLPGHYLTIQNNDLKEHTYWSLAGNARRDVVSKSREEIKKDIHQLLHSSVEIRMRADVPFGAFLSGGIDSGILVGLMSRQSNHKIKTFSVIFDEHEFDESSYSFKLAELYKTEHTPIRVSAHDFLEELPGALKHMDHPGGDGPNTYIISKLTRQHGVKMAITGLGGDELFAGYDVFRRMKKLEEAKWLQMSPKFARSLAGSVLQALKPSVASDKIAESLRQPQIDFLHLYPLVRKLFTGDIIEQMTTPGILYSNPVEKFTREANQSGLDLLSQVSIAEMSTYMQNVLLRDADQMSMAHALELRVPFLDHRLVEYVLGVSDHEKYTHTPKQLLTESMDGLLPPEIIHRPKMGFTFPWSHWMKNELKSFCEENLHAASRIPHFREGAIEHSWDRFLAGDSRVSWSRIWPLVVLGHWTQQHDVH